MKKILLTAIVAMFGMSAFAALPKAGDVGYLYNPAAGKFVTADAKLGDVGQKLTVIDDGASTDTREALAGAEFLRFEASTGNRFNFFTQGMGMTSTYFAKFVVKETEKGLIFAHQYPNGSGPDWMKDPDLTGTYLVADGDVIGFKAPEDIDDYAYWQFVDEDTYAKIAGPTYPIDIASYAKVAVTVEGDAATFTPTAGIQNLFQIKPFDVTEFRAYGYKKIVVEFSGAADGQFHAFAYGTGNDPNWDIVSGMENAPSWLAMGNSKYEIELTEDKIDDFTIFTWFGSIVPLTVKAYFSKEELATSISTVKSVKTAQKGIFNAAGQQMKSLQKGLNIVDGQKIYVK